MTHPSHTAATVARILHEQRMVDAYLARQTVTCPPGTKAWMAGPHPDDNLLGPGGVTLQYVARGVPVHWVCITDGRACVSDAKERQAMAETRASEERECAQRIGATVELLGIAEDRLAEPPVHSQAVERVRQSLNRVQPDAVFVPYALDTHPLHRLTADVVARALVDFPHPCQVYSWALGAFPPPRLIVDITAHYASKRSLVEIYRSQLSKRDYLGELDLLQGLHGSYAQPPLSAAELYDCQEKSIFVAETLPLALNDPDTLRAGVQPMVDPDAS